jgi:ATP-dependent Lhr-like helicase
VLERRHGAVTTSKSVQNNVLPRMGVTDRYADDLPFDPESTAVDDEEVLALLEPVVQEWWVEQFGEFVPQNGGFFTPPQKEAIPLIHDEQNALVCSPTGSGKTLAAFSGIVNELFRRARAGKPSADEPSADEPSADEPSADEPSADEPSADEPSADGHDEGGEAVAGELENSVYCLYVSPLKSLANDIHRNLEVPLSEITEALADRGEHVEVRHAIRHGDTSDSERQQMLHETPHILNTTPETLAILLNSPKFREKLRTVEYVIVDEIHSLAENKRGTHLSVSLERLEALAHGSPTRIGCSATVEPLDTMAEFLVGCEADGADPEPTPREYELVDTRFVREFDIELTCPADDLIHTPSGVINDRFYEQLHEQIQAHTNTLVFTNTRSGAERVLHNLRDRFDGYDEATSGCHHGSLSKTRREEIERALKAGELDVVTTSTSLELGIDMPHLDLVVQVGSPKSVAALLQRVGRAGHQVGDTVTGRVVALDRDELVECAVMLRKAEEGFVDRVFVPEKAQDVATQHVYGMAINGPRPEREVRRILQRAYPYRDYSDREWEQLMRYMTADYGGMEEKNVYAKIWRDTNDPPDGEHHYEAFDVGEPLVGKRGRLARVIYMTNIGTIPDSFTCGVYTRSSDEWVGQLDEEYLDTLETGDVFVLGGDRYEFRYRRGSKVYVDRTNARPTVPSWFSERLPLSYDLGREILAFQRELLDRLAAGGRTAVRVWLRESPLDEHSVQAITRMFDQQVRYAGTDSVSTDQRLVIEEELDKGEYRRHYYVHSNYGRRFNDGLSRLLAYRCAQEANANVAVAVADHGFTLSLPLNRKVDLSGLLADIDPAEVRADLRASLDGTDLLKRYFRIDATRALMILKRYKGYEKSASQQQVNSEMLLGFAQDLDEFAVVEETYREILEDKLHVEGIETVLGAIRDGDVEVVSTRVESPSPMAFGLATLMASDVVLAEDESRVLQEFHQRVLDEIEGEDGTVGTEAD